MSSDSSRTIVRFTAVMAIVSGLDLLTKEIASVALAGGVVPIAGPLDLALVQNSDSAFGISLGAYTWHLNALATVIALGLAAMAVRALTAVDRQAPIALGLIAGAAIGNLTSLFLPPAGVTDFLSLRVGETERLIMNLADVAAYTGLAMTIRSAVLLSRAIGAKRAVRPVAAPEIEVPIPLAVEGLVSEIPAGRRRDRAPAINPPADLPRTSARPG